MKNLINSFSFFFFNGAYSELAGKEVYPKAYSVACKTFEEMFESVRDKRTDVAIVPIENSRAGRVADTQRLIPNSKLKIVGEFFLEVRHCLMAPKGASMQSIKRVHSHEQAIAQCRNNLIENKKDMMVAADTAGAAKMVSELNNKEDAAIASDLAAKIYDFQIIYLSS
jgi:prephenate dehydratase